jgi:hypothetical protein
MSIQNKIALAHLNAFNTQGKCAELIRTAINSKQWDQVGSAYGELLDEYGKRQRIKGTKEFTPSTPADTFNTQIQQVTKDMECGKLKPVLIEDGDGCERWGLEPVKSRQGGKRTLKKLEDLRAEYVAMFEGRSYDEKVSELEKLAIEMGVKAERANVEPINKKSNGKKDQKAA